MCSIRTFSHAKKVLTHCLATCMVMAFLTTRSKEQRKPPRGPCKYSMTADICGAVFIKPFRPNITLNKLITLDYKMLVLLKMSVFLSMLLLGN
jgi:hypothetical protein